MLYVAALVSFVLGLTSALECIRNRVWGTSEELISMFNTRSDTRELIYFSTLCIVVGTTLLTFALDAGSLTHSIVSICTIAPLTLQQVAQPRWTHTIVLICIIACLANVHFMVNGSSTKMYQNVFGSLIVGMGLGLYTHVVARTPERSGFGNSLVFLLFTAVNFLMVTPFMNFRELEGDLLAKSKALTPTVEPVGPQILYLIVNSLLTFVAAFTILNAVQHPQIRMAELTIYTALIPTVFIVIETIA